MIHLQIILITIEMMIMIQIVSIRDRYKDYIDPDGNSPTSEMSDTMNADRYPTSASTLPT